MQQVGDASPETEAPQHLGQQPAVRVHGAVAPVEGEHLEEDLVADVHHQGVHAYMCVRLKRLVYIPEARRLRCKLSGVV